MKNQKNGLLQRVRIVLTALVVLAGLGSTLMAMKPADKRAAFTYGVAETTGGMHYRVVKNLADIPTQSWTCDESTKPCLVGSDIHVSEGGTLDISQASIITVGEFNYLP